MVEKTISLEQYQLECRLELLDSHIALATELDEKMQQMDSNYVFESNLDDLYNSSKGMLKALISQHQVAKVVPADNSNLNMSRSRLPKMALPKFSGKYSALKNFISLFATLVTNRYQISKSSIIWYSVYLVKLWVP